MELENEDTQAEPSLRETIEAAVDEHAAVEKPAVSEAAQVETEAAEKAKGRDEKGRFAKDDTQESAIIAVAEPQVKSKEAPFGWTTANKAEFNKLPVHIQDEILRREDETHKTITKHDEERVLGKSMRDVISPYMAIIQAEGGTPQGAVKDLLNTAYVLRTGSPQQKLGILSQVAQQYGVDLRAIAQGQTQPQQPSDPHVQALQQQVAEMKKIIDDNQKLQTQQDHDRLQQIIGAFAEDPKNVHFSNQKVKAFMKTLLEGGHAQGLQDAYDQAIYALPEIRSTLTPVQAQDQAKRQQEVQAKKKAGSSITGGPGSSVPNTGNPERSLREELQAQLAASRH